MNTVLVQLPDGGTLALDIEAYRAALTRGRELVPSTPLAHTAVSDEVLDAAGMQERTNGPATWWLEAARRGDIPHIRAGKYVRFNVADAIAALTRR